MFMATIRDCHGRETSKLYFSWEEYHKDVFNPESGTTAFVDFHVKGQTYAEKKNSVREIAIGFQIGDQGGMYWSDYAIISNWLYEHGKRFGLLCEFRENGIC